MGSAPSADNKPKKSLSKVKEPKKFTDSKPSPLKNSYRS